MCNAKCVQANDKCKHSINSIYYLPVVHRRCIILYIHTFMYNIHKQTGNSYSLTHTCHTQTDHRKCPCASSTSWRISFMYCSMALHWWCVSQEPKYLWKGFYYVQMSTHHHHHHQSILLMLVQSPVSPERPAWSSCLSGLRQWSSTLLVRV